MKDSLNSLVKFLRQSKKTIALVLIIMAATLTLSIIISMRLSEFDDVHIPSLGIIRSLGVEVYGGNIDLTQDGKPYFDWGTIYLGKLTNRSLYIRSNSNTQTTLNLTITNLTFQDSHGKNVTEPLPIADPLNLKWNYNNTPISPNETIYVTLTLEASSDSHFIDYLITQDVKNFSFDTIIRASEKN